MLGNSKMAASVGRGSGSSSCAADLLHPELLTLDFMKLLLDERKIRSAEGESRDRLTSLFLRHVMPRPQRPLPDSRWGRRMERSRPTSDPQSHRSTEDHNRKRHLIISQTHSNPLKVKKRDLPTACVGRLKPPPTTNVLNPIRKLSSSSPSSSCSSSSSHNTSSSIGRVQASDSSSVLKSSEMKKKIHHVTWP